MKKTNRLLKCMVLVSLLLGRVVLVSALEHQPKILVLHSYHPSFDWTKSIHDSIIATFDQWGRGLSLSVEYMDTKRLQTPEHIAGLATLYEAKYSASPPDLVITSDNAAFELLYEHRRRLFGRDIPVVFCAVNFFDPLDWPDMTNIVGVDERPDLMAEMDLLDRLFPESPPVAFILDRSETGLAVLRGVERWLEDRPDPERFHIIIDETPEGVIQRVDDLPENAVLHYHSYVLSPDGRMIEPLTLLNRLSSEQSRPIFSNYDFMLNNGIVGGPIIDGSLQGRLAALLAIDIIEGRLDPEAFWLEASPYSLRFDYDQLRHRRSLLRRLLDDAILMNEPDALWREYPTETLLTGALLLILASALIVTTRLLGQRARLLSELGILNTELEDRVQSRSEALKQAELELIRKERLATLGSLVAGVAHEVNTPLGLAITGTSFLKDQANAIMKSPGDTKGRRREIEEFIDTARQLSETIEMNLHRAAHQVNTFKQVAVDQTGEQPRLIRMCDLLNEFLTSMTNELKKTRLKVNIHCDVDVTVEHFPGDLWRILANLLMNSIKHAYPRGGKGVVTIWIVRKDDHFLIEFCDDGRGLPPDAKAQAFDPFFTTARDSGGTGLGLHLVKSIVEDRHGGKVVLESQPDEGTCITVTLPLLSPALSLQTPRTPEPPN